MFDDMKSTREREMPMSRTWMRELYYIRIVLELCYNCVIVMLLER